MPCRRKTPGFGAGVIFGDQMEFNSEWDVVHERLSRSRKTTFSFEVGTDEQNFYRPFMMATRCWTLPFVYVDARGNDGNLIRRYPVSFD
jgi:hypothetical protein